MLYRFHVTPECGEESDYFVVGDDSHAAVKRLQSAVGTNDKIHESFPAPEECPFGEGVYLLPDMSGECDAPYCAGYWMYWHGAEMPRVLTVQKDRHGKLQVCDAGTNKWLSLAVWAAGHRGYTYKIARLH